MDPVVPTSLLVVALVGVSLWKSVFSADFLADRRLRRPRTLIRDARDGELVKIVGRPRLVGPAVSAPFSDRECALYSSRLCREERGLGLAVAEERGFATFEIEDESGRAVVLTSGAELHLLHGEPASEVPELYLRLFLSRHHPQPILDEERRTVTVGELWPEEALIGEADEVAIFGVVRRPEEGGPAQGAYRDAAPGPPRVTLQGPRGRGLLIGNDPRWLRR